MKLPILQKSTTDINEFIKFWSKLYQYPLEPLYNDRIHKKEYSPDDLLKLFIWKNGMNLSANKQKSFEINILPHILIINKFKENNELDLKDFLIKFNSLTAVWKIFLLHIIRPDRFPIYDQNINRAYNYIHGLEFINISATSISNREKEQFYFETYLKFVNTINNCDLKTLDEAFFSFGQFINTKTYSQLVK
jgi:hypothetical protein